MSDYIMNRESLKRHCEATCKKFKDFPTSGTYGEHRLVLDLLEQTEWIPVSERLPEKDDLYLICFDDGEYDLVYFSKGAFSYSGVIAWMPLPKPYKAEMESEE